MPAPIYAEPSRARELTLATQPRRAVRPSLPGLRVALVAGIVVVAAVTWLVLGPRGTATPSTAAPHRPTSPPALLPAPVAPAPPTTAPSPPPTAAEVFVADLPVARLEVWQDLAHCESRTTWDLATGNGFYGGLQFTLESWEGVGGLGRPDHAPWQEQVMRAEQLHDLQGWGAWPGCAAALGLPT